MLLLVFLRFVSRFKMCAFSHSYFTNRTKFKISKTCIHFRLSRTLQQCHDGHALNDQLFCKRLLNGSYAYSVNQEFCNSCCHHKARKKHTHTSTIWIIKRMCLMSKAGGKDYVYFFRKFYAKSERIKCTWRSFHR